MARENSRIFSTKKSKKFWVSQQNCLHISNRLVYQKCQVNVEVTSKKVVQTLKAQK